MSERRDGRSVAIAGLVAASIIALQVAGKATRDSVFLVDQSAAALPGAMLVSALASLAVAWWVSRWMARVGPKRVAPRLLALATLGFAVLAGTQGPAPELTAYVLFVHLGVVGPIMVSAFWSVINERFDPHSARRSMARIAGGATAGGVLGGLFAEGITRVFGPSALLPFLAGLSALVTLGVLRFARGEPAPSHRRAVDTHASEALAASPYLRRILALVAVLAIAGALLDVALKTRVDFATADADLPSFFARYYAALGLATFGLQWLVAGRLLERAGLAVTLAVLPLSLLFGAGGAALFVGVLPVVLARGSTSIFESSLFRSAYELLYTPIAPGRKRAAKVLLDVGGTRVGDALGSSIALGLAALLPLAVADRVGLGLAAALAVVALILVRRLERGYVDALAESVRSGTLRLDGPIDPATRSLLSTIDVDRASLLGDEPPDVRVVLASRDPEQIRRALAGPLDASAVDAALGLLTTEHARRVERRLRKELPRHRAVLEIALSDPSRRVGVRQRLPALIATCGDEAALDVLLVALSDPAFGVRRAAAASLRRLVERAPELRPTPDALHMSVRKELARGPAAWRSQDDRAAVERATLGYVLALLALAQDDETIRSCHVALAQGGSSLRGTAIEYLSVVVPDELREPFFVLVDASPESAAARDRAAIADELLRSLDSLTPPVPDDLEG